jgi:hypothetical protein
MTRFKQRRCCISDCAYSKPKPGRTHDAVRQVSELPRWHRPANDGGDPTHTCSMKVESGPRCSTKRKPSERIASVLLRTRSDGRKIHDVRTRSPCQHDLSSTASRAPWDERESSPHGYGVCTPAESAFAVTNQIPGRGIPPQGFGNLPRDRLRTGGRSPFPCPACTGGRRQDRRDPTVRAPRHDHGRASAEDGGRGVD